MVNRRKNRNSLVSIIKVETANFEDSNQELDTVKILREKFNIFSDPVVFLHRIKVLDKKSRKLPSAKKRIISKANEKLHKLAKKGNSGIQKRDPHTCCLCKHVSKNFEHLKVHLKSVHGQAPKMFCDLCPKTYFDINHLKEHMKIHSNITFACNVCNFKTCRKNNLKKHKLKHGLKVQCKICKKLVTSLKGHLKSHAPKETCPICKKVYPKKTIKVHIKQHERKIFKCQDCEETYGIHEDLRRHIILQHFFGKIHKCDECASVFKAKKNLYLHKKLSHGSGEVSCKVCRKIFAQQTSFLVHWKNYHLKTHGPAKAKIFSEVEVRNRFGPFECDQCGLKFEERKVFTRHFTRKHTKGGYVCDSCPKTFYEAVHFKRHYEAVHLKLRPYSCDFCRYKTSRKLSLQEHMLCHSSKIECKVCHKMVTSMPRHAKSHIEVKCVICCKKYSMQSIATHMKNHKKMSDRC